MDTAPPPVVKRRRPRVGHISLGAAVLIVLALAGSVAFILSEAGLPFVIERVVEQSGGRLSVKSPSGSLARTMRFEQLAWRGPEGTVVANAVVVEWSPMALFSSRLAINGLGAREVSIALKASTGATSPPTSLALPLGVQIDHAAVATLTWQAGPRSGKITGLEFGYAADGSSHAVNDLRLISEYGALRGNVTLGATAPFPVAGTVAIAGDGPIKGAVLDTTLGGTLAAIAVAAKGTYRDATLAAQAQLTPFAAGAFERASLSLANVELTQFAEGLPHARMSVDLDVAPRDGGFGGTFRAANVAAGTLDDARLPVTAVAGTFSYAGSTLNLADLDASLMGGGHIAGEGSINLAVPNAPSRWRLAVRDLDLARLHRMLIATQLAGTLDADVDGTRQTLSGNLRQAAMSVTFAATYADRRLDVSRFRAEAMGGALSGSGRISIDAPRAFDVSLAAQHFDPSRFGAFPAGALDATGRATGVLLPEWRTTADIAITAGSRLKGVAIAGTARGTATRRTLADAAIELAAGGTRLTAKGSAGAQDDKLQFALTSPHIEEIAPLLPFALPQPLAGKLQATGTLRVEPGGVGGDITAHGEALRIGNEFAAAALTLQASIAPGGATAAVIPLEKRSLHLAVSATRATVRQMELVAAHAEADGNLASHTAKFTAKGADIDADAEFSGGLAPAKDVTAWESLQWNGKVVALRNRGDMPFALAQPATLEFGAGHARLAQARLSIADGNADIGELAFDNGRVTTRGTLEAIPLASVFLLAGRPLPLASTLTLSGDWSVAATPRLSGTFSIRRAAGDIYGATPQGTPSPDLAFGIETLELTGKLADDALDARLDFRSQRAGRAQGTLSLGASTGASPGHIARNAPLRFALDADLLSLAPLQPWLGTAAVANGTAHIALTGHGTLDAPILDGTLTADGLRVDAPQYGIALRDGRVRAHLADGGIAVDEISIAGGEGRFTASGTIAARNAQTSAPRTRIAWHADNFRVTNRPDLRLVVAGEGTLAIVDKRLDVAGKVNVVDGTIEYEPVPPGQLGPDVVVVGRPRPPQREDGIGDLPLRLEVDVDLGSRLRFSGMGLETGLTGRVRVTTASDGRLLGNGSIVASNGTYFAFGQRLTIDRGRLIFDGPLDNPALDVVALRKNLAVEAGVELTGTARVPRVRITSNPPVPENEALAWLVTGEGLSSGRSDFAALSAASAALLSSGGRPITAQIAQSMGLDDISVRSVTGTTSGTGATNGTTRQVVFLGKRITDRLTLGYQQGLSIATNALRIEYALTNTLTLRAEAGTSSGVGIVYRRAFD